MNHAVPPIDFRADTFIDDPYPVLGVLRERDPVHRAANGVWLVTRHADVITLNRDPRFGRDLRRWDGYAVLRPYLADSPLEACAERWMFSLDPPEHTRLRRLVAHAFTPAAVASIRNAIESIADELLDELGDACEIDFISAFARPFPTRVIARILGLPIDDYETLRTWSDAISRVIEPAVRRRDRLAANDAAVSMTGYLRGRVAERRGRPVGDVLSALIQAEEHGDRLSEDELLANLVLLFVAGHETTTHLLGNGLLALHRFPGEARRLREDPALLGTAVEELLRFDGPANVNTRVAHENVTIAGRSIEAGQLVLAMLGSANRDPTVFFDPDRLDIGRNPNPHVTFGGGPHFCIGAPLARLEAEVALARILARFRGIEVDESSTVRRRVVNLRGLERLGLRLSR